MTDEIAMQFYLKSDLPDKSYYKSLAGCAIRGYRETCLKIIKDRVNKDNVDLVLSEIDDFVSPYNGAETNQSELEVYNEVMSILHDIKKVK